jgi:hypothetical protein
MPARFDEHDLLPLVGRFDRRSHASAGSAVDDDVERGGVSANCGRGVDREEASERQELRAKRRFHDRVWIRN